MNKKDDELEQTFNKPDFDFFNMSKTEKMFFMLFIQRIKLL